jgi:hypothetical protein
MRARHLITGGRRSIYSRRLYQFGMLLRSPISCLTAALLLLCVIVPLLTRNCHDSFDSFAGKQRPRKSPVD